MALICISLMANNAEHLLVALCLLQFLESSLEHDCILLRLLSLRALSLFFFKHRCFVRDIVFKLFSQSAVCHSVLYT